ncbi:MAG: hypothetical protein CW742_14375, partial [Methanoregula sp.]
VTCADRRRWTGGADMGICRMRKGNDSRGKTDTGLLEEGPALSCTDRTVTMSDEEGVSVRRRTEAFTWSREIFRQWANGGACWLDHDPKDSDEDGGAGSFTALQHVYSSFTATAVNQNGKPGAPGSCKEEDYTNNSVLKDGHLQQNRNYGDGQNSGKDTDQCLHDSENAVNKKRSLTGAVQKPNPAPPVSPVSYSTCCKTAETSPDSPPPAVNKDPPRSIRAGDYKKLEIPEPKTPCYACGKKGSRYIEKYTKERRARPRDQQEARRICRSCFNEAVKTEQTASVPLPGAVEISRCSRVTADIGKCSVCGVAKAVWLDREMGVKLCEHCYGRGVRDDARKVDLV